MEEWSLQFTIPEGIVVVKEDVALRVEAGDTPKSISILRAKILNSTSLTRREDFEMSCFVDIFFNHSEVVDSLHKE